MSVKSRRRQLRREALLAVPHIRAQTTRTGKHALGREPIVASDTRIPKRLLKKPNR